MSHRKIALIIPRQIIFATALFVTPACSEYHFSYQNSVQIKPENAVRGSAVCDGKDMDKVPEDSAIDLRADFHIQGNVRSAQWVMENGDTYDASIADCVADEDCSAYSETSVEAADGGLTRQTGITANVSTDIGMTTVSDSVGIYTDAKPQISVASPADGDAFLYGDDINMVIAVNDTEDCRDDLKISIGSSADGVLAQDLAPSSSGVLTYTLSSLSTGDYTLIVYTTDSMGQIASTSIDITVMAVEECNGLDDDGDGVIPVDEQDYDGDGYMLCEDDCNDQNDHVHPDADEVCDGIDNDCDEEIDEDPVTSAEVWNGIDDDCDGTIDRIPLSTADYMYTGQEESDGSGYFVSPAGDVDGDGLGDILIGAPLWAGHPSTETGMIYLILGKTIAAYGSSFLSISLADADYIFEGDQYSEGLGYQGASAGDVNGDGYDDFVLGASCNDVVEECEPSTYLVLGRADFGSSKNISLSNTGVLFYNDLETLASFTYATGAGDINADGYTDLIITVPYAYSLDGAEEAVGRVYLLFGSADIESESGLYLSEMDLAFVGEHGDDGIYMAAAGAGDTNGDGYDDILIGSKYNDAAGYSAGQTYLILGREAGDFESFYFSLADADEKFLGEDEYEFSGYAVAGSGDVNGDGLSDFVVGAPHHGRYDRNGMTYLIFGSNSFGSGTARSLATADYGFTGDAYYEYSGWALAGLGDVDADGLSDFAIGAPYAHLASDGTYEMSGHTYVVNAAMLASHDLHETINLYYDASALFWGEHYMDLSGSSVSSAGDVNGDGYPDLLIGAYQSEGGGLEYSGKTYLVINRFGE